MERERRISSLARVLRPEARPRPVRVDAASMLPHHREHVVFAFVIQRGGAEYAEENPEEYILVFSASVSAFSAAPR
jgi:hypothetical protein